MQHRPEPGQIIRVQSQLPGKRRIQQDRPAGIGARQRHTGLRGQFTQMLAAGVQSRMQLILFRAHRQLRIAQSQPQTGIAIHHPVAAFATHLEPALQVLIRRHFPFSAKTHGIECTHEIWRIRHGFVLLHVHGTHLESAKVPGAVPALRRPLCF